MFPFPPPPPSGPDASGGVTPAEKGRIVMLGVAFLVVMAFGAFLFLSESALLGGDNEQSSETPPSSTDTEGTGPAFVGTKEPRIVPLFPEDQAQIVRETIRDGLSKLPAIIDGASGIDPEPYDFMLSQAAENFRVINLKSEVFEVLNSTADIREDPGSHRGRMLRVSGELLSIERLPYDGKSKIIKELRRGVIRAHDGTLFTFTEPVGLAFGADAEVPADGWIRLHGLFYKTWRLDEVPGGGEGGMSLHVILKRPPQRDYPPVTIADIDPAWLNEVQDSTPAEMHQWDRRPLYFLLNFAKTQGTEGFNQWLDRQQAEFPDLKIQPPEEFANRAKELLDNPDAHRFQPVTYTGFLARPSQIPDLKPNPGNIEELYLGFLVTDDYIPVWVCSHQSFRELGFDVDDRVRMRGFYYMRTSYRPRGGGDMLMAPIFVAVDLEKLPPRKIDGIGMDLLFTIIALMTGLIGLLGFAAWQSRKEARLTEERRLKKVEKRRKARREATSGDDDSSGNNDSSGNSNSDDGEEPAAS